MSDQKLDALKFEPILESLEVITPLLEIFEPGLVGFPTRGPSRFFGGEQRTAEKTLEVVCRVLDRMGQGYASAARIGIADGVFAAKIAASSAGESLAEVSTSMGTASAVSKTPLVDASTLVSSPIHIVEPGKSADFLTDRPATELNNKTLVDVLLRLGLQTLGAWAALPVADVSGRFGQEGLVAHRLARGLDDYPPDLCRPAPELSVSSQFEPPVESIAQCGYQAAVLAERFLASLQSQGLTCTRLGIEVETENGATLKRWWRHSGAAPSARLIASRVMAQLEGWLLEGESVRPRSGILRLVLIPDEVVPSVGEQLTLWNAEDNQVEQIGGLISRLQSMLGSSSVLVPKRTGGIGPNEQVALVEADPFNLGTADKASDFRVDPWPGHIPAPAPARVFVSPAAVGLVDQQGLHIEVSGRGELQSEPAWLVVNANRLPITAWAGPWLDDQHWWDHQRHRRRARVQVQVASGRAYLLVSERQRWWFEAAYD